MLAENEAKKQQHPVYINITFEVHLDNSLLSFHLILLGTVIKQLLVHFHKEFQGIVDEAVDSSEKGDGLVVRYDIQARNDVPGIKHRMHMSRCTKSLSGQRS